MPQPCLPRRKCRYEVLYTSSGCEGNAPLPRTLAVYVEAVWGQFVVFALGSGAALGLPIS